MYWIQNDFYRKACLNTSELIYGCFNVINEALGCFHSSNRLHHNIPSKEIQAILSEFIYIKDIALASE